LALTLVLSATHVYFRDAVYLVQASLLVWFYATPIFYPISRLHGVAHTVITINPFTGVVEVFHAAILGATVSATAPLITVAWSIGLLAIASVLHRRLDRSFADLL
jgi:ABC-type polysaccharide/polyol phosphate export permease